jgi:hypothetical protein
MDITDQFNQRDNKNSLYPASFLSGELKKKWIIGKNNVRYLIKENAGYDCQQSIRLG